MVTSSVKPILPRSRLAEDICIKFGLILQKQPEHYCRQGKAVTCITILTHFREKKALD